jgi:hypothetical protein
MNAGSIDSYIAGVRRASMMLVCGQDWPPRVGDLQKLLGWACHVVGFVNLMHVNIDLASVLCAAAMDELVRGTSVLSAVTKREDAWGWMPFASDHDGLRADRLATVVAQGFPEQVDMHTQLASTLACIVNTARFFEAQVELHDRIRDDKDDGERRREWDASLIRAAELLYGTVFGRTCVLPEKVHHECFCAASEALLVVEKLRRRTWDFEPLVHIRDGSRDKFVRAFPHVSIMSADDLPDMHVITADVDRSTPQALVSSSYNVIMSLTHEDAAMLHAFDIMFVGETGFGLGVARDWITSLCDILSSPDMGLFHRLPHAHHVVHPTPGVRCDFGLQGVPTTLWMEFVGRVLGLALRMGMPTGIHLSRSMTRLVRDAGCTLSLSDLSDVEPGVHLSCARIMRAQTQKEIDDMLLPGFAVRDRELLPNGSQIRITLENRSLLLQLIVDYYCNRDNETAIAAGALRAGMAFVAPMKTARIRAVLAGLAPDEFNLAVGGQPVVSCEDIKQRCRASQAPDVKPDDMEATMIAFWSMVADMSIPTRQQLLRFWTGSSSLSPDTLDLAVVVVGRHRGSLPTSRTCYCQLYVPVVSNSGHCLPSEFERAINESLGIDDDNDTIEL